MRKSKNVIFILILFICATVLTGCNNSSNLEPSSEVEGIIDNIQTKPEQPIQPVSTDAYNAIWLTYLELETMDFTTEQAFTTNIQTIFAQYAKTGINTVIAQVRPFGDALYKSDIFPTSHIITDRQGGEITFDPLEIMVREAHQAGIKIEAWINPYRVKLSPTKPETLADTNPAVLFQQDEAKKHYVFEANGGLYYNPAITEVQQLISDGVVEIMQNYQVDGIHFDDYFYPEGAGTTFDLEYHAQSGTDLSLEDWRRENVNSLIRTVYADIKAVDPNMTFGVSPQGNNDNNYNMQYSDVGLWLSEEGYVDYIMPQLYWGYDFVLSNGNDQFGYSNCLNSWLAMPRHENVDLHIGIGAYRVGSGDGSNKESNEWQNGNNLAKMVNDARLNGADGIALYRHDFLFNNTEYPDLARQELENLEKVL